MPFLWDEKYRLGIPEIDRQHQTLLLLLNKAFDFYSHQMSAPPSEDLRQRALQDLNKLREFARAHFATEEELMARFDYPQLTQHLQEHGKFLEMVAQVEAKTATAREFRANEWIEVMLHWYDYHVQHEDRDMGVYLRDKAVSQVIVPPVVEYSEGR